MPCSPLPCGPYSGYGGRAVNEVVDVTGVMRTIDPYNCVQVLRERCISSERPINELVGNAIHCMLCPQPRPSCPRYCPVYIG
ncbi:hypothetical protein PHET_01479 [Paragonimus heterotremus]|uniref:Uncharacterized protein n=1 Tax=Paragonimus heterotremus TaxID=100268 RepID=A0A8J4TE61_9TREM|nr:hypothetical protein PHET_01479 [Paragonimus heterotremus]